MSILNAFPGNPGVATSEKDGLMSKFDKAKLDNVESYANNYIHPESHPASMITESDSRQFITKEEREKLNTTIGPATQESDGLMSSTDKSKLDGIATNANYYVHPVEHPASMIVQNDKMRFVTDTEKATWNAKASTAIATQSSNGLMSTSDKIKLDGIDENANNYVHPETHPAGMIVEDTTHRFATDTEKTTWNNKADKTVATSSIDGLMSSTDKSKLDGIAVNANNYVHPSAHPATIIETDSDHRFASDAEKQIWNNKANNTVVTTAANGLMSSDDKQKLDAIEENANYYVHPGTHAATMITQDTTHRFVSDTEKATWNNKADKTVATTGADGLMSAEDKIKLDGIEENANNYVHPSTHEASMITQDATHRFVSDSEKSLWNSKASTKADVGLGNVTNDAQVKRSEMGVANGVATLDTEGKVPAAQLPSYVDDVVEVANFEALPETGESGKIYIAIDTNTTYRWSGSLYVPIGNSLALGETSSTAYAGNKGKANADEIAKIKDGTTVVPKAQDANTVDGFTVAANVPANAKFTDTVYVHPDTHPATMIDDDTSHRFVTDAEKATWNSKASTSVATQAANGLMSSTDKTKLDGIAANANNYTHPESHPASMIVEDTTHRFVTDDEKDTWDSKANSTVATTSANGLMSASDKSKLDNIAANANNYVHPTSHAATMITTDETHRFVSDTEKATWNAKASTAVVTTNSNGLMSAADKQKLDGIATNANNYTHPSTHPASMIEQNSAYRFVSDTEKTTWNNKANANHTHTSIVVSSANSATNPAPNDTSFVKNVVSFDLKTNASIDEPPVSGSYSAMMNVAPGADQSSGNGYQFLFGQGSSATIPSLCIRTNVLNGTAWGPWYELYTTANKPTPDEIGAATSSHTHAASTITEDTSHRFVTDSQISTWTAKANTTVVTQSANGLMSAADKVKLDSIASNANNYVHPSTHAATMITEDASHRFVTDTEKATWNAKASIAVVTTSSNGLMSSSDKSKLDGIAANANNYTHPSTHAATMIVEDTSHRFVTDTQINTWNNKANTTVASSTANGLMSSTDKNTLTSLSTRVATLESNYASMLAKLKTAVFI